MGVCLLCMSAYRVHRSACVHQVYICACDIPEVTRSKMGKDILCLGPRKSSGKSVFMSLI